MDSIYVFFAAASIDAIWRAAVPLVDGATGGPPWRHADDGGRTTMWFNEPAPFAAQGVYLGQAERNAVREALGGEIEYELTVDISGASPADVGDRSVVTVAVLRQVHGVAMDDYSNHLWTRGDLEAGRVVDGHRVAEPRRR